MEDCLDSLGEAAFFKTLDCNSGYWQIPVAKEDREKTAFTCHEGCFEFCRTPLGLCNAPATFQRAVDMLLSGYRSRTCLVSLDDIIVFSKTAEEHVDHVRDVLTVLKEAGFSLKLKKCKFFATYVDYLGHVTRPGRLEVATKNTEAVKRFKEPTTQTELRSFLGLCNIYRRFVPNFARIAALLKAFLRKEGTTELPSFNEEQLAAFEPLKKALLASPILRLPRTDLPYSADMDACNHQIGFALLQTYPDGTRHPIGFWSRSLNLAEKKYSVSEKECLAIFWAVQLLRPYLEGIHFDLYTNHQALRWIHLGSDHSGRLTRWRLRLLEFDFTVTYKKGAKNTIADVISRLPTYAEAKLAPDTEVPCYLIRNYDREDPKNPQPTKKGSVSRFVRLSRAMSSKKTKPLNPENVETINHEALGPRQEKTKFSQRLKLVMKTPDARLEKSQARYKRDFDKRVRHFITRLEPGDLVFDKRETATESEERNRAARGAAIGHHKLRSKANGPYQVVSVTTSTVTIMRDGLATKSQKTGWYVHPTHPPRQWRGSRKLAS